MHYSYPLGQWTVSVFLFKREHRSALLYISIFFRSHFASNNFWILFFKLILNHGLRNISDAFKLILLFFSRETISVQNYFESLPSSKLFWFSSCSKLHIVIQFNFCFKINLKPFLAQNQFESLLIQSCSRF